MKLRELKIKSFRNLRNFEICFDETPITVLLGKNGAAKSNLIEFIAHVFAELEMEQEPKYAYLLRYRCNAHDIEIDARFSNPEKISIKVDDSMMSYKRFIKDAKTFLAYLPTNVFIYYSGLSNRLEETCKQVKARYKQELRDGNRPRLRRLFLTDGSHSSLILFTFLAEGNEKAKGFLKDKLGIVGLESVTLKLTRPSWIRSSNIGAEGGWDRIYLYDPSVVQGESFWNTSGEVLSALKTFQYRSLSLRHFTSTLVPRRGETRSERQIRQQGTYLQHLYFHFNSLFPVQSLLSTESLLRPKTLFQWLDDLRMMGFDLEMNFKLRLSGVQETISISHLSEGEQQLLTVIGLLRFTKENDTLFLLDEPDTHLNPQWSYEYKTMLEDEMETSSSQIIIATHDPVLIAGLRKENVRIMERKELQKAKDAHAPEEIERIITASPPAEHPQGMGVARILTSSMFGLRSILDEETVRKLEHKRELAFKNGRTDEEIAELKRLTAELQDVDMTSIIEDPLYTYFVQEIVRHPDYLDLKDKFFFDSADYDKMNQIVHSVRDKMLEQVEEADV